MNTPLRLNPDPLLWLQALTLLLAGVAVLVLQDRAAYFTGLGVLAAVGAGGLLRLVLYPTQLTIWDILMVSICLGYGVGTLNTELTFVHLSSDYLVLTTAPPEAVQRTTGWLLFLGAALCGLSSLDRHRVFARLAIPAEQQLPILLLVLGTVIVAAAQIATGAIGYHGGITEGESVKVSPLAALTTNAVGPVAGLACFVLRDLLGWRRALMALCVIALLLFQLFHGRRVFIYSVVLCLVCFFAARSPKRLFSLGNLLALGMAALMMLTASKAFFALRMAKWELGTHSETPALLSKGYEIFMDDRRTDLDHKVSENQSSRTFIVGYLAELMDALDGREPLYGELMVFDIGLTVPSALWPEKYKLIALGSEEAIANPRLGLPVSDQANSLMTAGASDFGLPGIFLYPALIVGLFSLCLLKARQLGGAAYLMIAVAVIDTLLNVEAAMADYFNILRSIGLALALAFTVRYLYRMATTHLNDEHGWRQGRHRLWRWARRLRSA